MDYRGRADAVCPGQVDLGAQASDWRWVQQTSGHPASQSVSSSAAGTKNAPRTPCAPAREARSTAIGAFARVSPPPPPVEGPERDADRLRPCARHSHLVPDPAVHVEPVAVRLAR